MTAAAPWKKILLYVEANEKGLEAARYAIALAKRYESELHAVSVVNEKVLEELLRAKVFLKEEGLDIERDLEEDGKRYLAFVAKLAGQKSLQVTTHLLRGAVHREVLEKAKEVGASLLVIGEIGESLSRRDCTYNESERIVCTAECPVLVVKGRDFVNRFFESV
jgi:nucleotide-binding universal stress UspA family protein